MPVVGPPPAMAVVFQEYGRSLFPWMTVHDNVALPLKQKKMTAERREELVRNALAAVDLAKASTAPIRGSSPAACSSASPLPAPSPTSRMCC